MSDVGYFREGDEVHGPFEPPQLLQLVETGRIKRSTLVRRGTSGPWYEAEQVKGLFSNLRAELRNDTGHVIEVSTAVAMSKTKSASVPTASVYKAESFPTHKVARCPDCGASLKKEQAE